MNFWSFVARRSLQSAVTALIVASLLWALFRLLPGDPAAVFLGTGQLSLEEMDAMRRAWGLDRPLWVQYFDYIGNLLTGNFGTSFQYRQPVGEIILPAMGNTALLMAPAVLVATLFGIAAGAWLGWNRGSKREQIGSLLVLLPRSMPVFWIGILMLMAFAYGVSWFPIGGMRTPAFFPETDFEALPGYDIGRHMILPLMTAVIYFISDPLLIMRASMLEARNEDYVTFARAAGLNSSALRRIARRNAILPVITYTAIMVSFAFGGQVLLEVVFSWPGMGRLMVNAVSFRDYPVAQAAFFMMACVVIALNLVIDCLYAFLDPRISYA